MVGVIPGKGRKHSAEREEKSIDFGLEDDLTDFGVVHRESHVTYHADDIEQEDLPLDRERSETIEQLGGSQLVKDLLDLGLFRIGLFQTEQLEDDEGEVPYQSEHVNVLPVLLHLEIEVLQENVSLTGHVHHEYVVEDVVGEVEDFREEQD